MARRRAGHDCRRRCGLARRRAGWNRACAAAATLTALLGGGSAGADPAGAAAVDLAAPTYQLVVGWDGTDAAAWGFGAGMIAPTAAHPASPENPSGLVLLVPGLGWFEDFAVDLADPAPGWAANEFLALDYQEGPDRFASGWLSIGLIFSSARNWWYVVPRAETTLDGQWHTALWRYDPRQVEGRPLVVRLATSTGDAGTLFVDRLRWLLPLFRFECDDHLLDGWTLAEGSGLESRSERVHRGASSFRLFLPASTWHRAAWRTFAAGDEVRQLARCNRLALMLFRRADSASDRTFRLRLRLAWLSEPDAWGETDAVEVLSSDFWESLILPFDLAGIDPARPLRLYLITESFAEEEIYVDSACLLHVD